MSRPLPVLDEGDSNPPCLGLTSRHTDWLQMDIFAVIIQVYLFVLISHRFKIEFLLSRLDSSLFCFVLSPSRQILERALNKSRQLRLKSYRTLQWYILPLDTIEKIVKQAYNIITSDRTDVHLQFSFTLILSYS